MRSHSFRRRVLSFVLILCLLVPVAAVSASASEATEGRAVGAALSAADFPRGAVTTPVLLNGREVLAGECYRLDGVTYVPLRRFCDIFAPNGTMTWNGTTSTARFRTDSLDLTVRVGRLYITANGHSLYTVGAVRNLAGHLYVAIRPLARAFAAALKWDAAAGAVVLTRSSGSSTIARASYNADEVYWLSRIISAEASVEPFVGQIAVGNVVLNRVRSREFPNTIYGVIFDRKHGTQFSPVAFGTIYEKPEPSCVIAAQICLEGYSVTDTALYFFDPDLSTSDWISRNCIFEFRIGSHEFYH